MIEFYEKMSQNNEDNKTSTEFRTELMILMGRVPHFIQISFLSSGFRFTVKQAKSREIHEISLAPLPDLVPSIPYYPRDLLTKWRIRCDVELKYWSAHPTHYE